jgi:hypothetical protein
MWSNGGRSKVVGGRRDGARGGADAHITYGGCQAFDHPDPGNPATATSHSGEAIKLYNWAEFSSVAFGGLLSTLEEQQCMAWGPSVPQGGSLHMLSPGGL